MLILERWVDKGGLFRLSDGRVVFRSFEELAADYLPFVHNSPKGQDHDMEVFVWKGHLE
jgi:hypothetical protein